MSDPTEPRPWTEPSPPREGDDGDEGAVEAASPGAGPGLAAGLAPQADHAEEEGSHPVSVPPPTSMIRAKRSPAAPPPFALAVGLFVASGAAGLVDQLCFSKYLSTVVGSTAHAVSAVLAAFMAGLAIGAHFGGRWSARVRRPLLAYGVLELAVAASVAAAPFAFGALTEAYVALARVAPANLLALSVLRWAVAMLLVILPTMAMGATLPLLCRGLGAFRGGSDETARKRQLGGLYAANTLGGAAGALAAAYLVLPWLGVAGTLWASAALSALIGVVSIVVGGGHSIAPRSLAEIAASQIRAAAAPRLQGAGLLAALALGSGALVFAAEVVFTHLLALVIGNSAYAFGLILAVFLVCLCFGASLAPRVEQRLGNAALGLGLAASGLALMLTLPLWDLLPLAFVEGVGTLLQSFEGREALRALVCFVVLVAPTTLMGLTFPLLLQRVANRPDVGALVGRMTAINTIGAVFGALGTGYVLLPLLGSQRALIAIAAAFALCGIATGFLAAPRPAATGLFAAQHRPSWLLAATIALAVVMPRWDLARLTSGSNVYFDSGQRIDQILMLREDVHGGVTTVTRAAGVTTLYTNGKFQGNTGWEMNAQRFFAHYPSLFVERFESALVIGLGTGTTLGTLAAYPWQRLSVVEISPAIVAAARDHFLEANHGALDDPRVELHLADGRNHLLVDTGRYDLISMELSSIWFAGAASLYSAEYYELVRAHLKPRGVFQQWVQLHHVSKQNFATILNTLRQSFKHVVLFYGGGQGILVASESPLRASAARLSRLQATARVAESVPQRRPLPALLSDVLLLDAGIDRFLQAQARAAGVPLAALTSTDDNLYLEYATPRGNVLPWSAREALVADLRRHREPAAVAALLTP